MEKRGGVITRLWWFNSIKAVIDSKTDLCNTVSLLGSSEFNKEKTINFRLFLVLELSTAQYFAGSFSYEYNYPNSVSSKIILDVLWLFCAS